MSVSERHVYALVPPTKSQPGGVLRTERPIGSNDWKMLRKLKHETEESGGLLVWPDGSLVVTEV